MGSSAHRESPRPPPRILDQSQRRMEEEAVLAVLDLARLVAAVRVAEEAVVVAADSRRRQSLEAAGIPLQRSIRCSTGAPAAA